MSGIEHWVAGKEDEGEGLVRRLRWPIPAGVAQAYVIAYSEPGTVVLVPYCQGPSVVREIQAAGRRPLALNFDPLSVLVVEAALSPVPAAEVDAAVARLGDSLKQEIPLRFYLSDMYASICPACSRPVVADFFVWDRELGTPVAKHVRCNECTWNARTGLDAQDWEKLAVVPSQGMHYHYILDRLAPQPGVGALRTRLEYLLELYSPRNLYALAELTLRIESMFPSGPAHRVLKVLLLECLEHCSSLAPLPGRRSRRRGLSRPGRYLERNVWHAFGQAASRYVQNAESLPRLAESLEAFAASQEEGVGYVGQGLVRDACRVLPPRSVDLIVTSPPALDAAAWSLSYLWGAWLLGAEAAASLQPLLRQRTPDPEWYARGMARALGSLVDLLRDDGRLVFVLAGQRSVVVEALVLAAGRARLGVTALTQQGTEYRLELAPTMAPVRRSSLPLTAQIRQTAVSAASEAIRKRGEPVPWKTLHAAILRALAQSGLLVKLQKENEEGESVIDLMAEQIQVGLEDPVLRRLVGGEGGEQLWWLADPSDVAPPLCDRVEMAAYELLRDTLALTEADFAAAIYPRFLEPLTPPEALVAGCLRAYGQELTPGIWQLRTEDLPDARQAERETIIEDLKALGLRLGFQVEPLAPFDVAWLERGKRRAAFAVRWQAALEQVLAFGAPGPPAIPYMVIPGGRAALASYKLAYNPLWQRQVDEQGWRFIKYRHVRQLVARPDIDEYALQSVIGLDPIVEQERAQLPLF
jgi:hypothetical protein